MLTSRPAWAGPGGGQPPAQVVEDIEVWRAAMAVSPDDRRPTGPVQRHKAARMWQRRLDEAVAYSCRARLAGVATAGRTARTERNERTVSHPFWPAGWPQSHDAGVDAKQLLRSAVDGKPLPDDHAAAALWWRICRHLNPALLTRVNRDTTVTAAWESRLAELVGAERAQPSRPARGGPLVTAVDHALQRGWRLEDLLRPAVAACPTDVDQCQAMVWRISVALDCLRTNGQPHPSSVRCPWHASAPPPLKAQQLPRPTQIHMSRRPPKPRLADPADGDHYLEPDLAVAAMLRDVAGPPEQTDADVNRMFTRAMAWRECPVSEERMVEVNQLSLAYFRRHLPSSWAQQYLADRFGEDITDDLRFQPGQAPAGWTNLVDHLRRHGVTDEEMTDHRCRHSSQAPAG